MSTSSMRLESPTEKVTLSLHPQRGRRYRPPMPSIDAEFWTREDLYRELRNIGVVEGSRNMREYGRAKRELIERLIISPEAYDRFCQFTEDFIVGQRLPDRRHR